MKREGEKKGDGNAMFVFRVARKGQLSIYRRSLTARGNALRS